MRRLFTAWVGNLGPITEVVTPKNRRRSLQNKSIGEQRIKSNPDGRHGADEDTQSYFPIHLGRTKMNWEWKTDWKMKKFTSPHSHSKRDCRRIDKPDANSWFCSPSGWWGIKDRMTDLKSLGIIDSKWTYFGTKLLCFDELILWREIEDDFLFLLTHLSSLYDSIL